MNGDFDKDALNVRGEGLGVGMSLSAQVVQRYRDDWQANLQAAEQLNNNIDNTGEQEPALQGRSLFPGKGSKFPNARPVTPTKQVQVQVRAGSGVHPNQQRPVTPTKGRARGFGSRPGSADKLG